MKISGWGRYPDAVAEMIEPVSHQAVQNLFAENPQRCQIISRGSGRSYGDSALAEHVLSTRFFDNFISLNTDKNTVRCGSGVQLKEVLHLVIPKGYFPPVLPGTKYVTVGGAIAADIHGKNHHREGSFCQHVSALTLMLANGDLVSCSESENKELFFATCGGMGLTGIILDATFGLKKVPSASINQRTQAAQNLNECMDIFDSAEESEYSVAWIDCLARGKELGRSLVHTGNHSAEGIKESVTRTELTIPFVTPAFFLNKYSIRIFNELMYQSKGLRKKSKQVSYEPYFFPLDGIKNWNLLYGSKGFIQYQFFVPLDCSKEAIPIILKKIADAGKAPSLSVLKKFGEGNNNYLSFPGSGYSLAMDFKRDGTLFPLLAEIDDLVLAYGGRQYLAKDARMSEKVFKRSYANWEKFVAVKSKYDPKNIFASHQSKRLGLTK